MRILRRPILSAAIGLVFLWNGPRTAQAHGINAAYLSVSLKDGGLLAEWSFPLTEIQAHFSFTPDDKPYFSAEELASAVPAVLAFIQSNTALHADNRRLEQHCAANGITRDAAKQEFLSLSCAVEKIAGTREIRVGLREGVFAKFGESFSVLAKISAGDTVQQAVLSIGQVDAAFTVDAVRPLSAQLYDFLRMGVRHIFLGYDHILFLIVLLLVRVPLSEIIKAVSAFTVAHSITLILATLNVVTLPGRLTESCIALSIVYVAAENLWNSAPAHRWRLTFIFGLVHGFGFAGVLREMGLPRQGLIASLLAFNVGVELGQLAIVLVLVPVIRALARTPSWIVVRKALSSLVMLFGLGWLIERAFALRFMPF